MAELASCVEIHFRPSPMVGLLNGEMGNDAGVTKLLE